MSAVLENPVSCTSRQSSGKTMSEWSGRQEEMMSMIGSLNQDLETTVFRDRDLDPVTAGCCSCASGQSGAINFCKHER